MDSSLLVRTYFIEYFIKGIVQLKSYFFLQGNKPFNCKIMDMHVFNYFRRRSSLICEICSNKCQTIIHLERDMIIPR